MTDTPELSSSGPTFHPYRGRRVFTRSSATFEAGPRRSGRGPESRRPSLRRAPRRGNTGLTLVVRTRPSPTPRAEPPLALPLTTDPESAPARGQFSKCPWRVKKVLPFSGRVREAESPTESRGTGGNPEGPVIGGRSLTGRDPKGRGPFPRVGGSVPHASSVTLPRLPPREGSRVYTTTPLGGGFEGRGFVTHQAK